VPSIASRAPPVRIRGPDGVVTAYSADAAAEYMSNARQRATAASNLPFLYRHPAI
jgi:hypothetical protein